MKKRWLSVIILAICVCLLVPTIASCGCSDDTDTNTETDTTVVITLKLNGGSLPNGYSAEYEWETTDAIDEDELPTPTKEGTEFKAWTVDGEEIEFPYTVTGDTTFVATWADGSVEENESDTNTDDASGSDTETDTETGDSSGSTDTSTGDGSDNTDTNTGSGSTDTDTSTGNVSNIVYKSAPIVKYLRIAELGDDSITLKFNLIGNADSYEIRYSTKAITDKNYAKATVLENYEITGDGEIKTIVIPNMTADSDTKYYFTLTAENDFAESERISVRAGGIEIIPLDYTNPQHLMVGETNRDLTAIIDEQDIVGDPLRGDYNDLPATRVPQFWYAAGTVFPNYTKEETDERYGTSLAPIIDLEYIHYVDTVLVYYNEVTYDVIVRASKEAANFNTPEHWDIEYVVKAEDLETYSFNEFAINSEIRYVQVEFVDGESPNEVIVYGYAIGESADMEIKETSSHKRPTIGAMMGQCGFVAGGSGNCSIEQLACSYVIREYHNVGWSYSTGSFPGKAVNLGNTVVGNFDSAYKTYSEAGFLVIPCLQWNEASSPARVYDEFEGKLSGTIASWEEKYLPSTYAAYADLIYQYAARYGSSKMGYLVENMIVHSDAVPGTEAGRGYIEWIELGNEPNGEDAAGATAYQLAALTSAAYDGHQRTLLANVYNPNSFSYPFGGKTADPDIKLAIAGLAGVQDRYIMSMAYWMRANRTDGCIAMDAFNVHTYFGKYFYMNDQAICVGVSPEEYGLVDALADLVQFRDKYYPDVEVWLTEFGWDTNQSYETMTSAHAYNTKDLNGDGTISEYEKVMRAREIQGMWLVRAYILLSSTGVDKATMYMCEDVSAGTNETTAIGKYGTCGIWAGARTDNDEFYRIYDATWYDAEGKETTQVFEVYEVPTVVTKEDGSTEEVNKYYRVDNDKEVTIWTNENTKNVVTIKEKMEAKDGYYYMYTLTNTIGDMTFVQEIDSGNKDVWVYQFANDEGEVGYAVWCPTSDGTVVENFQLRVEGKKATLVQSDSKNKDIDGVSKNLQITNGYVSFTVSENPVYVVVK
ncbi:MAG: hypothetical protein IJ437_05020 [Clostridia bacterium]|nr:hypothetical protein [Clostridia bacterium]